MGCAFVGRQGKISEVKNDVAQLKPCLGGGSAGLHLDGHCWVVWERGNK